jgi:hypothetical protein
MHSSAVKSQTKNEKSLVRVHEHMLGLALGALAHANWHANYYSMENEYWNELSVLQAVHAGEILIKARIAQEHPLLIFENLPKAKDDESLSFRRLVEEGRTFQFTDLPDRLWATTGIRLPGLDRYRQFGRLRNAIQHFTVPLQVDVADETIRFIYEVIDPFINKCWRLYAIDYNEDHEPYVYLVEGLIRREVRFLVSPDAAKHVKWLELDWPEGDRAYRKEMEKRFEKAHQKALKRAAS